MKQFGNPDDVKLIAGNTTELSQEALNSELSTGLRMLHIDAGHEYHEVLQQMLLFAPFVRPGGIIIMDDYQDREFPGIEAAVLDFSEIDRPRRFVPFFAGGNKMYLCETNKALDYQKALLGTDALKPHCRVTRVRDFTILVGFSKLPVDVDICLRSLKSGAFPLTYSADQEQLRSEARLFQQTRFGSGH